MKKISVALVILLCLLLLTACTDAAEQTTTVENKVSEIIPAPSTTTQSEKSESEKEAESLSEKIANNDDCIAVAYIGYYEGGFDAVKAGLKKSGITKKYPFINEISDNDFYALEGNQVYVIVPADGVKISLRECGFNEEGNQTVVDDLAVYKNARPFIIKGNISDSRPDFLVEVFTDNEKILSYNPILSMDDGKLVTADGVFDFTPYELLPFYEN